MGPVKAGSCEGPVYARYLSFISSPCADQQPQGCKKLGEEEEEEGTPGEGMVAMSPILLTPAAVTI